MIMEQRVKQWKKKLKLFRWKIKTFNGFDSQQWDQIKYRICSNTKQDTNKSIFKSTKFSIGHKYYRGKF